MNLTAEWLAGDNVAGGKRALQQRLYRDSNGRGKNAAAKFKRQAGCRDRFYSRRPTPKTRKEELARFDKQSSRASSS